MLRAVTATAAIAQRIHYVFPVLQASWRDPGPHKGDRGRFISSTDSLNELHSSSVIVAMSGGVDSSVAAKLLTDKVSSKHLRPTMCLPTAISGL